MTMTTRPFAPRSPGLTAACPPRRRVRFGCSACIPGLSARSRPRRPWSGLCRGHGTQQPRRGIPGTGAPRRGPRPPASSARDLPGDRRSVQRGDDLDSLGNAHVGMEHYDEGLDLLRDALALRRQAGDRMGEADTLSRIAGALHDKGEASAARESWRLALLIFDELGAPQADEIRIRLTAAAD